MKKIFISFFVASLALLVSLSIFLGYLWREFALVRPSDQKVEAVFEVKPGSSFSSISKELEKAKLVVNSKAFYIYARLLRESGKVKVGEYALNTNMTAQEVLNVITSGMSIQRSFTVAEGKNIFEIAQSYEENGYGKASDFLKVCRDPSLVREVTGSENNSLEGYLFPETYMLTKYTTTRDLVGQMIKRFNYVFEDEAKTHPDTKLSKHQIITLASIVEKETGAPEERPMIASVFLNRLEKRMMLQTDPTIIYAKALVSGKYEINIRKDDITAHHPYNTYTVFGLPPGPIASPGRESLKAVFSPAQSKYVFFVSKNNGTHIFSEDYQAHEKAVNQYQLDKKSRAGHSWKELSQRKPNPTVK